MKRIFYSLLMAVIIMVIIAIKGCPNSGEPRRTTGQLWNRANASTGEYLWNFSNPSPNVYQPIWNPLNPSYRECSSWTGAIYAPEGATLNVISDTASYNPLPDCPQCHGGSSIWGYNSSTTGVANGNGSPQTYGE